MCEASYEAKVKYMYYEAKVITNGKKREVQVGPGGNPVERQE